jgi:hypothetical protein
MGGGTPKAPSALKSLRFSKIQSNIYEQQKSAPFVELAKPKLDIKTPLCKRSTNN